MHFTKHKLHKQTICVLLTVQEQSETVFSLWLTRKKKILTINLTLTIFTKLCACTGMDVYEHASIFIDIFAVKTSNVDKGTFVIISPAVNCPNDNRVSK